MGGAMNAKEVADDSPPGSAPVFGAVPDSPFENEPEHLVLSSDAHFRLSEANTVWMLGGEFDYEALGTGRLVIEEVAGGEVLVHADVLRDGSPSIHLDARVRESWLVRAAAADPASAAASVVRALVRLAEIPHQSTVRMSVAGD